MQDKPSKQRPVLFAGLVIGAISGVPGLNLINCCCCAGIIFGGALAYYLNIQEYRGLAVPDDPQFKVWIGTIPVDLRIAPEASDALILGILSGIVGALVATLIKVTIMLVLGPLEGELVRKLWEKLAAYVERQGSVPSGSFDQLKEQLEKSIEDSRRFGGILRELFFSLIIYPIFSMLGGLIGYGLFGRKSMTQPANPSH